MYSKKYSTTTVLAHIDHGKTTFIDCLLAYGGFLNKSIAGEARILDNRDDEQARGITMKNSVIYIDGCYFIDTPGHVDFEQYAFSASQISDNFIIIVDILSGIAPRMYSLVKFINPERSILFINKIDYDIEYIDIIQTVEKMNSVIGKDVFSWEKNNVVLGSAIFCTGISHLTIKERFFKNKDSFKNSLKFGYKCFKKLSDKIRENDIEDLKLKYNIKIPSKKEIYRTIFNLAKTIIEIVKEFTKSEELMFDDNFVLLKSPFAINSINFQKSNSPYFLFKVINGELKKGDILYYQEEEIKIEKIVGFIGDSVDNINHAEKGMLVLLNGNFNKNPTLSNAVKEQEKSFPIAKNAFFKKKIILEDYNTYKKIESVFKVLSLTEQGLNVMRNKYGEYEITCYGEIQFEKICNDLKNEQVSYFVEDFKCWFAEKVDKFVTVEGVGYKIVAKRHDEEKNYIEISGKKHDLFLKSLIAHILKMGLLIKEHFLFTKIHVSVYENAILENFKSDLILCIQKAGIKIIPYVYDAHIYVAAKHINNVFNILSEFSIEVNEELYDDKNDFVFIKCTVPMHALFSVTEKINRSTKGNAYITLIDKGFVETSDDLSEFIHKIQKEKGIVTCNFVVKEGTKQRTRKK